MKNYQTYKKAKPCSPSMREITKSGNCPMCILDTGIKIALLNVLEELR
jgi:hypothetical protein